MLVAAPTMVYRRLLLWINSSSLNLSILLVLHRSVDGTPPVITGPNGSSNTPGPDFRATTTCNSGGTTVNFPEPTATDNSGTVTLLRRTPEQGSFFPVGSTEVTYVFVDPTGNTATYSFNVVVEEGSVLF